MIARSGYFEDSHDPNLMAGSFLHDPSQTSMYNDNGSNNEQVNFKVPSFSIEDLSNPTDMSSVLAINHLQHQLGIDLEHNLHSHMVGEVPPVETANWDPSVCAIQDHILSHQIGEDPQNISAEQQIQDYDAGYSNSGYTAAPDLLNLLQIPKCTVAPAFHPTASIFGDPGPKASNYLDMNSELPGVAIDDGGLMLDDSTLQLGYHATPSHLLMYHSLPQNYGLFSSEDERDAIMGAGGIAGNVFQEMDGRQFDGVIQERRREKREFAKGKAKANFATERERRVQLNVKYEALRSLFPNPTKNDRASVVGDAIEYINELNRTVKELKILVEKKRHGGDRRKIPKLDEEAAADGESSSLRPVRDDQESQINGAIRSSWVQRRSKECHVDVRIVDDEVNIKLTEKKKTNCLLCAAKVLDEFQLELIHAVGAIIGDHHIFMFNTKTYEGSSVYACAVAKKLLEAMERQHQTLNIFT